MSSSTTQSPRQILDPSCIPVPLKVNDESNNIIIRPTPLRPRSEAKKSSSAERIVVPQKQQLLAANNEMERKKSLTDPRKAKPSAFSPAGEPVKLKSSGFVTNVTVTNAAAEKKDDAGFQILSWKDEELERCKHQKRPNKSKANHNHHNDDAASSTSSSSSSSSSEENNSKYSGRPI